jgi:hypothetical protein
VATRCEDLMLAVVPKVYETPGAGSFEQVRTGSGVENEMITLTPARCAPSLS